jgi:hypothetical protein
VDLYKTGRIVIRYKDVYDPAPIKGWGDDDPNSANLRQWLVGLRPASDWTAFAPAANTEDWGLHPANSTQGVYPRKADVVSNSTLTFWPIAPKFCFSPRAGNILGGTVVTVVLHVLGPDVDMSAFALTCRFGAVSAPLVQIPDPTPSFTREAQVSLPLFLLKLFFF